MPMSKFPHSGSVVLIEDNSENHGKEARVHYVMAHNGCQQDPVLTCVLLETNLVIDARVSGVTVVRDGLEVSI